ncbi:MAG: ribosome-associated translation inhibitor RaiA [Chloroflexi bacterium]|nr:ribosome-associated translation inhibitor RaiA [Chloroflexota bacterium]
MDIALRGRNVALSDAIRDLVARKVGRLARYFDRLREVQVAISQQDTRSADDRFAVEITANADGTLLRAEERGPTVRAALDRVVDVMHQKLVRYKDRLQAKPRAAPPPAVAPAEASFEEAAEAGARIVRVKRPAVKPISPELVGHDFFVFINAADERVNVLYRRRDGNYGLIVPEEG